jgi:deoxyribodipyrimidine photolyase-like uncharacterized protein
MAVPQPKPSRDRMRAYRERLRARGLKPLTIWVPDLSKPEVRAQLERECRLLDRSPDEQEVLAWMESLADEEVARLDKLEKG